MRAANSPGRTINPLVKLHFMNSGLNIDRGDATRRNSTISRSEQFRFTWGRCFGEAISCSVCVKLTKAMSHQCGVIGDLART